MIVETHGDTTDLSFYTDTLEALTLRPRRFWARFSLEYLRHRLKQEMKWTERRNRPWMTM
jgi:hypothetical protein